MPGKEVTSAAAGRQGYVQAKTWTQLPAKLRACGHAYLRGCRSPHSPFSQLPPSLRLPAPSPTRWLGLRSDSLADWLPSGPGDVISETWQPGESAPHGGGGGKWEGRTEGGRRQLAEEGVDPGTLRAGREGSKPRGPPESLGGGKGN